jgi:hypothetical protein
MYRKRREQMNIWDTQQTSETIRTRYENMHFMSADEAAKNAAEYKAEKVRLYKLRLIKEWRAKR